MNLPCIDCITLPICKAIYNEYDVSPLTEKNAYISIIPLMRKCTLVRYYMYRVDRESDQRELVPRNNSINIDNVHRFYKDEI
jgi:hypothetical protein